MEPSDEVPDVTFEDEGFIEISGGHRLWYRRMGSADTTPLLVLHGGPGASWDYLQPIETLSAERPVVVYDQLGSGRSDHPDDDSLWTITRYADEVDEVRAALGLDRVHLFGHSWGGWLAIEYLTRGTTPSGVVSLILGSTSSNLRQVATETSRLRGELPEANQVTMAKFEAAGDYHAPEYEEAAMEFYRRHVCRPGTDAGRLRPLRRTGRGVRHGSAGCDPRSHHARLRELLAHVARGGRRGMPTPTLAVHGGRGRPLPLKGRQRSFCGLDVAWFGCNGLQTHGSRPNFSLASSDKTGIDGCEVHRAQLTFR